MSRLHISLLGNPQIALDGVPINISTARAIPLIAFLAITGKPQTRETLANLLWAESSQKQAMAALRTTLWRLKAAGLDDWIALEQNEIALNDLNNIEVDVLKFKALLARCNTHGHPSSQVCLFCTPALTEATELYHGEFMSGFNITKAPTFDDWRMQQSESLQTLHLDALERLVKCHRTFGDFNLAIHYARTWISHDRLNENAYYQLLQLFSITGQRTAGMSLYRHYKDLLLRELAIEPSEEITTLYKQIITGQSPHAGDQNVATPVFLITDFERAAIYWARPGVNKNEVLATYTNIIRETTKRFGGIILQKSDDSITVLFENGQPLHCAVTIHLKLKKADWGQAGSPNVRMVLYSSSDDYDNKGSFSTITRAASNLLSISWGGQVVFTEQTLKLLDIPSGSTIKDLGYHYLKEIESSVHAYELLHPHLPSIEHQPLQSGLPQLTNFPTFSLAFVGREQELEDLSRLIESPDRRIISLVGPGGVGKTHLAVQFAAQVADRFSDGVYYISLASIEDPDLIPIVLADTLKFSFYGPGNYTEQLANYLHRMNAFFVFDNFEHLRVEGSKFLAFLLNRTHHIKMLVTTRERLNLIAETVFEVNGLPVPPVGTTENVDSFSSIQLFLHNAQKIYPRFVLGSDVSSVMRVCQLVDGLPLGIILASSWVRVYNCPEIAQEIERNIDFLTTSAPDVAPRHHSLRAVFDNSWQLLSQEEQFILRRLSIFRAAFTSHAAHGICAASPLILASFVDKSLLHRRQDDRYEMLATFHQFIADKLEDAKDEYALIKAKFCEYYAGFCNQKQIEINSPVQRKALDEFTSEMDHIRYAWSLMVDLDRWDLIDKVKAPMLAYHIILGNYIQGREFFRLALQKLNKLVTPGADLVRASMQQLEAWMTVKNGYLVEGLPGLLKSLETFRLYQSSWEIAMSLHFIAETYQKMGNLRQAKDYIDEAFLHLQQDTIPKSNYAEAYKAHCQSVLGIVLMEMGDYEQARMNFNASLAVHNGLGTYYGTIHPLLGLGRLAYNQGEFLQARDLYLQALDTASQVYDQRGMALLHNNLGAVYEEIVDIAESYQHVLSALDLCKDTGDRRLYAVILNNLAYHQLRYLKRPSQAIRTYQECIEIFYLLGDLRGLVFSCYDISKAYLKAGLVEEAWNYCLRSLQTAMTMDSTGLILHALHGFANLFANNHEPERALRMCILILNHPQLEPDTQKRAIVSKAELETSLSPEITQAARTWAESTTPQDVIDQILAEKYR